MLDFYVPDHAGGYRPALINEIMETAVEHATAPLERGDILSSPEAARRLVRLRTAGLEHEVFGVLFLDNRHHLIEAEELFRGTIDGAAVYPREVVKRALQLNANAVILYHNHPSGNPEPSGADQALTRRLAEALSLMDIRVLDHLVVGDEITSFAERGLL